MATHRLGNSLYLTIATLIQRLPDELHPYIFRELEDPIGVSHVCRAWRRLALSDPHLWTTIEVDDEDDRRYCNNPNLLNLFLTRSRTAPLTVEIHTCFIEEKDCNCLENLELIMDHLSHIGKLKVSISPHTHNLGITEILHEAFDTHQVPLLESLELSTYDDAWLPSGMIYYPKNAPSLRKLRLNDAVVAWDSTMFQNLTELYINLFDPADAADANQWMRIGDLFHILKACPSLTLLFLQSCFVANTVEGDDWLQNGEPIHLPCLSEISLHNLPIELYIVIAKGIKVPHNANWYIQDNYPCEGSLPAFCELLGAIDATLEGSRDLVYYLGENIVAFFSSSSSNNHAESNMSKDSLVVISLRLDEEDNILCGDNEVSRTAFFQKSAQIVSAINSKGNITRFCFRIQETFFELDFRDTVGRVLHDSAIWTKPFLLALRNLEILDLKLFFYPVNSIDSFEDRLYYYRRGCLEGMINALMPPSLTFGQESEGKEDLLCPNLHSLEIAHGCGYLCENLMRLFRSRSGCGAPIRSLRLTWSEKAPCRIPDGWLDEASRYVQHISIENHLDEEKWNGVYKPRHVHPGDDSNGLINSYFEYDLF